MNTLYLSRIKNYKKRHQKLFKVLKIIFIGETVPQKIAHFYLYLILLGAILLYLPISLTSYPNPYQKIINEDYFELGTYSALADRIITSSMLEFVDDYASIGNNLYVVRTFVDNMPVYKVIQTATYTFLDALFTAASAFSDTGLSTVVVRSTFSIFGQVVILLLIQIGGIGFIVIFFLIWKLFKSRKEKQDTFSFSIILRAERGNSKLGGTVRTIIVATIFIFTAEFVYAIFYSLYFNFVPAFEQQIIGNTLGNDPQDIATLITVNNSKYYSYLYNSPNSIWGGIFHSISSMNNAGFDIFGASSLSLYRNDYHAIFLFVTMTEFVVGGIGYPVVFDIYEKIRLRKIFNKNHKYHFSLFTKVSLITTLIISIFGIIFSTSVEMTSQNGIFNLPNLLANNSNINLIDSVKTDGVANLDKINNGLFGNASKFNAVWGLFFETMSTRSAGFSTINNFLYTDSTKGVFIALMFIGAAPSSTAGGIRTTTFAVMCISIWSKLRGRNEVRIFRRSINNQIVSNSFTCFLLILIFLGLSCVITQIIIDNSHPNIGLGLIDVLYELASAFGTVGLTTGVTGLLTSDLNILPFIFTILLMIIGQLGVSTTLLTWVKKNPNGNLYSYPTEELKIG